ncbi:RagB/SusD family nutrient uptake outer membrane protein [Niabella sp. CC-SYL272]|uniref:RagB/SusD family nutrient uptake outer membrane protein n=1 Tax=Niabella agricola TaxID=2891571 RepID=UPI001F290799|nr:RagB/SusD family nutrient uptake outer membrane protein [Niabella agricola]MCF3110711.1 RagB/SusD family nutrient uptake outer membrane protein [Niabella agricola]
MKTYIYRPFLILMVISCAVIGCSKDFLNIDPTGQVPEETTWQDPALAQAFITGIYSGGSGVYGLGVGGFDEQMLASLTDEATFTHTGRNINTVMEGSASPSGVGWIPESYGWKNLFDNIRAANLSLEKLANPKIDTALANRLKGEAHFLRAYFYHQLLRYYGGVPITTRVYDLNQDYNVTRNSFEECVNFITADCDTAIWLINTSTMDKGRASVLAALALKSRVLLYAASDLSYLPLAKTKFPELASHPKPELFGYTGGDRKVRWTAAKAAAKAVMSLGAGYKLNLGAPVSAAEGKTNYMSIAMSGYSKALGMDANAGSEIIFGRYYNLNVNTGAGVSINQYNGPNGYHNWAGNTPIGLLVDDYEMADGTPFSWSNPAQKAKPYVGRDPRFYATILYDGAGWKPRDLISGNVDPANQIQTGQYDLMVGGKKITFNGLDTRSSSIEDWNGSRTGYYVRKFTDPDPKIVDANTKQLVPWPFFRYTEAVFNYIEACIELGEEAEARLWLNRIRFRSGMPAVTDAGIALKNRYRNEKRIEMAFEEQRYFDVRRWMIPQETVGRKLTFINVVGTFQPGKQLTDTYRHDETIYNYTYTPVVNEAHENRKWVNKMYYAPINRDEMNKNTALVQNPGY